MRKSRGFTLIEIAFVLVIVGMIVALFASVTSTLLASQRRQATTAHLAAVDAALVQFVVQNQRLPCPAAGTRPSVTDPLAGTENSPCALSQATGVVPWKALGMAEQDATDGWGRRLTYRVASTLTAVNGMNMYWCDPAAPPGGAVAACVANCVGLACTSPQSFLTNKGFQIRKSDGVTIVMDPSNPSANPALPPASGAAYVIISAGESGGGAYTSAGVISDSLSTDGTREARNYANLDFQTYYVDDEISEIAGPTHFDDVLVRPTVLNVATRAGLGPRAH
ncbi:MAG: type II secretion system protein [Usitatibacter sp.]